MLTAWLIGALTALGAVLCAASIAKFRPTRFTPAATGAVIGWEIVGFLLLSRSVIQLAWTHGGIYSHNQASTVNELFAVASIAIIDALILWRILIFHNFRARFLVETEKLDAIDKT